ncbi:MAG: peptidylprolyl isomerase [Clostridia bacterium]|nr:peptidylprolyl isomerase [Clostridia bacterium]
MQNKHSVKRIALLLVAVMALAAFAGCSARVADPVVGKVGDLEIYYSTFYNSYQYEEMMKYYYGTGTSFDTSTEEGYREFLDYHFDSIINTLLPIYVAKQEGITLTEEEEANVQLELEAEIDQIYASYASSVDESITDEAAIRAEEEKILKDYLRANGLTVEKYFASVEESLRDQAIGDKYMNSLLADITVSDEEAKAFYDEQLTYYETDYANDPGYFYDDYLSYLDYGEIHPLIVPEGYDYYKHILIMNPEEGEEKDVDAIIAEIYEKINADSDFTEADFDALVAEYGEDTGMQSEPYKTTGYMISEYNADTYYAEFSAAALALENQGDITLEAVETSVGKHIIMKCAPVEARTVPFEEVEEDIRELALEKEKLEVQNDYLDQWREEVKIVKHYNRVAGIGR